MSTWWERATTEQRIAQIKGGIECGMNSRQISMNCGAPIYDDQRGTSVAAFAAKHGIKIPKVFRARSHDTQSVAASKRNAKRFGRGDYEAFEAFNIFNARPDNDQIFSFEGV